MGNFTLLRPHHILDIITKYGQNFAFDPHPYGHAMHIVAQKIVDDINMKVKLTIGADEICYPCRHLLPNGYCDDVLKQISPAINKQDYNDHLDSKLLTFLNIKPNTILSIRDYLTIINARTPGIEKICSHPMEKKDCRLRGLIDGLVKVGIRTEKNMNK